MHELEGGQSRVSVNRSFGLNLNTVEPPVSDNMQFLSRNMCSSMLSDNASSGRLQEFKNNGKLLNYQPEMSLIKEVVVYERFYLQGFHRGNFGILVRWSLREGGHLEGLV